MSKKIIVTIAPTGGMAMKSQNPNLPTQPEEIARDVYDCYNAGASVVAVHARRPDDEATCNADIYRAINERIRNRCDIIINNSTGGGVSGDMVAQTAEGVWDTLWEERLKGMDAGAEMCTLDAVTLFVSFEKEILLNTSPSRCRELAVKMRERGIKPEWEVFSPPHVVQDVTTLIEEEDLDEPPHFVNFVLNAHRGFQNAMPYTPKTLQYMVDLLPANSIFCASGIGPAQLPVAMNSLLLGGHVRTGLEDNLYFRQGELAANVQLTERVVRLVNEMGFDVATAAEARQILGLPLKNVHTRPQFAVA